MLSFVWQRVVLPINICYNNSGTAASKFPRSLSENNSQDNTACAKSEMLQRNKRYSTKSSNSAMTPEANLSIFTAATAKMREHNAYAFSQLFTAKVLLSFCLLARSREIFFE
jgi:hypothetical protein